MSVENEPTPVEVPTTALLTKIMVPDAEVLSWLPAAAVTVRRLAARASVDCLITSSSPESVHLIGLLLHKSRPAWIADFRDGWSFEPLRAPFPTPPQRALDSWLERRVGRTADALVGAYPAVADDLARRFGARAVLVPNAWDPESASTVDFPPVELSRGAVTLVYTGTFSGIRGLHPQPLLTALGIVRAERNLPPLRLVIAGRQSRIDKEIIAKSGLGDAVEHVGALEHARALALQRSSDALLLMTSRAGSAATSKVFEYIWARRPIVALAENNDAERIVRETNTGVTVSPDDVDAIAEALRKVASGQLAACYAPRNLEQFAYPGPAKAMAELVESAIARRAARRTY